ncbi:transporter [Rhodocyclus purpureus]|uniref:transporter n=1 Tax=Rhodocyclus purpureus TaxID=1067 RepID=UPI0019115880|nr:phenol degradation protein meta [Rhodocyclus purpureus]
MKKLTIAALIGSLCLASGLVQAKEGGDQYPNGGETWLAGAVPPPGDYFINYFGYYSGKLKDGNGNNARHPADGRTPDVGAVFDALRYVKVTDTKILGANWGWHVIVPFVNQRMDSNGKESRTGVGDITINPLILSWHNGDWHTVAALDINLPTGAYDKNDGRRSLGANYYSVEPVFAVTYLNKDGWEASGKFMYNIKTENNDTNYKSGNEFHMDYLLGKRFGEWGVGLSGYYVKQTTNDKQNGQTVAAQPGLWSEGRKGEAFAIGPSVTYTTKGGTHFIGQWQHETSVENRFGGDKFWFKLITAL